MKKRMLIALVVMLVFAGTGSVASAEPDEWTVCATGCDFTTIQDAVDGAVDGDTIYVHEGTYDEQVIIDGTDLSLLAVGSAAIAPSSCTGPAVIYIYDAVATIDGFTINAAPCMLGIYARSMGTEPPVTALISNNTVFGYEKNGITANGPGATATIRNNTVTGSGPVGPGDWAQNGIQLGYGAKGEVMRNFVDGNWYTGADWAASGILVFESDDVTVQGNTISACETGIAVEAWGWLRSSASYNKVVRNSIEDAEWAISVAAFAWGYSTRDPSVDNNKVANNVITFAVIGEEGDTGVFVGAVYDSGVFAPSAVNNKVIRNQIDGYTVDIDTTSGTATKVHANVLAP